ncbi:hypothetical protein SDC9_136378 [bioreactor metagenome]|mgnify:CR=1 FL=1|uniref:Cytochrome C n=1 Tax=bioreactor metagenome TaxID=1076179 RepID=A0A645DIG0_9ZZZZ
MNQPIALKKWLLGLLAVLLVGVTVVGFSQLGVNPTAGSLVLEEPFPYKIVDSSSCVACHTNESVIAASNWGKDKPVAVNTGG